MCPHVGRQSADPTFPYHCKIGLVGIGLNVCDIFPVSLCPYICFSSFSKIVSGASGHQEKSGPTRIIAHTYEARMDTTSAFRDITRDELGKCPETVAVDINKVAANERSLPARPERPKHIEECSYSRTAEPSVYIH